MGKTPADQFYWQDWARDLQEHPLEIEGAWIRICCKLWFSETRGQADKTIDQWARILGVDTNHTLEILKYLQKENIATIPDDLSASPENYVESRITVICRRMVREEAVRQKRIEAGQQGGNPSFQKGQSNPYYPQDNQEDNQRDNQEDKQKITTMGEDGYPFGYLTEDKQKIGSSSSSSSSSSVVLKYSTKKETGYRQTASPSAAPSAKPARPKVEKDPRIQTPELQLYRDLVHRYPQPINRDQVIEAIRDGPPELVRECYRIWCSRGFNPNGLGWLDWIRDGGPPVREGSGENGRRNHSGGAGASFGPAPGAGNGIDDKWVREAERAAAVRKARGFPA